MASPEEAARQLRELGKRIEINADKLIIETSLAVLSELVVGTPVDTGRARGNWLVGRGSPRRPLPETIASLIDPSGQQTIQTGASSIRQRRPGVVLYISNNVPYIGRLNDGSSAQAPSGFIEMAVQAGVAVARRARLLEPV